MALLAGWVSCKVCGTQRYKQQAYQNWHNVDCYDYISLGPWNITWVRNWWVCTGCYKSEYRWHDIDGIQLILFRRRK